MDILNLLIWLFIWPETKNDCQPVKTLLRLTLLAGKWRNSLKLSNKTIASLSLVYSYGKKVDDPSLFLQRWNTNKTCSKQISRRRCRNVQLEFDFTLKKKITLKYTDTLQNIKIKNIEGEGDSGALVKKYIIWSLH